MIKRIKIIIAFLLIAIICCVGFLLYLSNNKRRAKNNKIRQTIIKNIWGRWNVFCKRDFYKFSYYAI